MATFAHIFWSKARALIGCVWCSAWFVLLYLPSFRKLKIAYLFSPSGELTPAIEHAQVLGFRDWVDRNFPESQWLEFTPKEYKRLWAGLQIILQPRDIIVIHVRSEDGGGPNWADVRKIISRFKRNSIVLMPHTVDCSDRDLALRSAYVANKKAFDQHGKLIPLIRGLKNAKEVTGLYPRANVLCVPDFALRSYPYLNNTQKERSVMVYSIYDKTGLVPYLKDELGGCTVERVATMVEIEREDRLALLRSLLFLVSGAEVVVTDEIGGILSAVICTRPCVVVGNDRLLAFKAWFEGVSWIEWTMDVTEVPSLIEKVVKHTKSDRGIDSHIWRSPQENLYIMLLRTAGERKCKK